MRRLTWIIAGLALGGATAALAQGGAPPPANLHVTVPPGSASGVSNSISPGPSLDGRDASMTGGLRPAQGLGTDAAVSHPLGSVRGSSATAVPTREGAGMRGRQAGTGALTDPPSTYPVCRTRAQDRCRVR